MSTPSSVDVRRKTKKGDRAGGTATAAASVTASISRENARASTFGGRGNTRAVEQNRRPVFKATLDAAYNIHWPSMDASNQEELANKLCPIAAGRSTIAAAGGMPGGYVAATHVRASATACLPSGTGAAGRAARRLGASTGHGPQHPQGSGHWH
ncbi:hypothetical protein SYNPS1DRAFT_26908 [Syncephalis pseudoplumigaleata]|uniref:Uncharacterized protein n=1 Tax=Syncephalis pseudoplumigaleata TaxID=1712513 RepID=A0A4P9Z4D5_9FUNG|nr:hypothetical protein SYNPS1DRAFT_26908 [Syncephalis pseudoplumigaleata]|eukprot:RKP27437.1 hypothetical protein SYNPS1DRAFT_26908 [Syncephalis pseudoplumigaleata]